MTSTKWTEAEVRGLLEREDLAYQDIQLPYGLSTGGRDRSQTANAIFPENLQGKTVLDVGCKYGYFCFEALRRGAARVVGLDLDTDSLRKARLLADILGVQATFDSFDVERDSLEETFDYVLCLNLLHHLHNPLSAIDKLIEHTRVRLALEIATFGPHDLKKFSNLGPLRWLFHPLPLLASLYRQTPVVLLGSGGKKPMSQQFFMSAPAVETLLRDQHGSFATVRNRPSEHKGRFISVADKWQVRHLVLVSGPTSAGKSTLIRKLQAGELPELARNVGIDNPNEWTETDAQGRRWAYRRETPLPL